MHLPLPHPCQYFFFTATPTTEIYTLSLHDALPIYYLGLGSLRNSPVGGLSYGTQKRVELARALASSPRIDRKSTRLNSSHMSISYAVFCLKKKKNKKTVPINTYYEDGMTSYIAASR